MKFWSITMIVLAFCALPSIGQQVNPLEHIKVEQGKVLEKLAGKDWQSVGDAKLANGIKALQDIYPDVTIAMDPRMASLPLSDLRVRANDPKNGLEALRAATGGLFDIEEHEKLFTLAPNEAFERPRPWPSASKQVQVFNISGYLNQLPQDSKAEDAIDKLSMTIDETRGDLDQSIPQEKIRYHAEAKLLVITGTPEAIDVAAKVINALPGQQPTWFGANPATIIPDDPYARGFNGAGYGGGGGSTFQQNLRRIQATPGMSGPMMTPVAPMAPVRRLPRVQATVPVAPEAPVPPAPEVK